MIWLFLALFAALYVKVGKYIAKRLQGAKTEEMTKITLYINGTAADLPQGEALLLFNYQQEDLSNPAAVLNSYSRELTLPPTDRNNRIFGEFWRPDKVTGAFDSFDALARVPFSLVSSAGVQLESGYVKLTAADRKNGYDVTLYGGLGSFIYGLMYDESGEKKSLASLDYGTDLGFTINAATVAGFWDGTDARHDIINFAPMYNGLPKDFDASHALIPVGEAKCAAVAGESGKGGFSLVDLGKEFTEWEVRDLRSYLQRPVVNLFAVLQALTDANNNGGFTFDYSDVQTVDGVAVYKPWMALPLLSEIDFTTEDVSLVWTLPPTAIQSGGSLSNVLLPTPSTNATIAVDATLSIELNVPGATGPVFLRGKYADEYSVLFVQLCGIRNGQIVAGSDVVTIYPSGTIKGKSSPAAIAKKIGYTPKWGNNFVEQRQDPMTVNAGVVTFDPVSLKLEGYGLDALLVHVQFATYNVNWYHDPIDPWNDYWERYWTKKLAGLHVWEPNADPDELPQPLAVTGGFVLSPQTFSATSSMPGRIRSGAAISQADLLGGTASPADILLGMCKTFGWVLAYDGDTSTVRLLNRDTFYTGEVVDLQDRIDRSQAVKIRPNIIEARWLNFALGESPASWAEQYAKKYGAQYGAQRVNTGSPFNGDTEDVLEGIPFQAPVGSMAYGRYFYIVQDGGTLVPAPWLDNGLKYTLWDNVTQEPSEHDVPAITSAVVLTSLTDLYCDDFYARVGDGYDTFARTQAQDGSRGGVDISGALLYKEGTISEYTHLTDDSSSMLDATGGSPCWVPCLSVPGTDAPMDIPSFLPWAMEYCDMGQGAIVALDMGEPKEVDVPTFYYKEGTTIYARRWAAFIADRYDADARVCECYVDFKGMQVGQPLFGKFFAFDGALWSLNKITDYCLDNPAPALCEFIRVHDTGAYTSGQNR